jgi:hypothetical protein
LYERDEDMKLGFTGTRKGSQSTEQYDAMLNFLENLKSEEFIEVHHGVCAGADEDICSPFLI